MKPGRPRLPPDHVRLADLIGRRAVSPEQAERNRQMLRKWRLSFGLNPRQQLPGLTPYREAADVWAAIDGGEFPPPRAGPWGLAWFRADVDAWLRARCTKKTPRTL